MKPAVARVLPILGIAALASVLYYLGLHEKLSVATLGEHRAALLQFAEAQFVLAVLSYMAAYTVLVAMSLPGATIMSLAGGFIFGGLLGGALVILAATAGATLLFLAARTAAGDMLKRRAGPTLKRIEDGFHQNALHYLLFLRLVPLFPFWIVNIAMAILGMRTAPFVVGTLVGIIPGTFVYTTIGSGLGAVLDAGNEPKLTDLLSPALLTALFALGVLALLPVVVRATRASRPGEAQR